MSQQNSYRRNISLEDLQKRKQKLAEIKAVTEVKKQKMLAEKSKLFQKMPGKLLKGLSYLVAVFCIVFIVDSLLSKTYTEYEVRSNTKDIVPLIKGGYVVNSTFHWVYLDNNKNLGVHIHKSQFEKINETGKLDLGKSPIFNIPYDFRIKNIIGEYEYIDLITNFTLLKLIPFVLLLFSVLWIFSKPHLSFQWVMFGYFIMVVLPVLFCLQIIKTLNYINDIGIYEIDVSSLSLM